MSFVLLALTTHITAMRNLFAEQEEIGKQNVKGRGPILVDICFLNKSETDSNIWFTELIT